MKNRIIILLASITAFFGIGCSYVSDSIEGAITNRASFNVKAEVDSSSNSVTLTWEAQDTDSDYFAGIEIYRTSEVNDEYSEYITVADRLSSSALYYDTTDSFTDYYDYNYDGYYAFLTRGIYFYRVAYIDWEGDPDERDYTPSDSTYPDHTSINAASGYVEVTLE